MEMLTEYIYVFNRQNGNTCKKIVNLGESWKDILFEKFAGACEVKNFIKIYLSSLLLLSIFSEHIIESSKNVRNDIC